MPKGAVAARGARLVSRRRMAGLSLVELMIALGLGVIISAGVLNVFIASKKGYYEDEQTANMQENARFALRILRRELSLAGYMAGAISIQEQTAPPKPIVGTDCSAGWALSATVPMEFANNVAASYSQKCVSNVVDGTDVLAIRRAADDYTIEDGVLKPGATTAGNRIYFVRDATPLSDAANPNFLVSGNTLSGLPQKNMDGLYAAEYLVKSFYVRDYSSAVGDGIPCLVMASLDDSPAMKSDCLVEGVEDFQVEFGIDDGVVDTAQPLDRVPNRYLDDPSVDDVRNGVTSVTLYVLVRSTGEIQGYNDEKTYQLGTKAIAAKVNDHHYRRVFNTTLRIPNIIRVNN